MNQKQKLLQCDCCAIMMPCVAQGWTCGLETWACHICRGWNECDECDDLEEILDENSSYIRPTWIPSTY